jgi:hypothetical protein
VTRSPLSERLELACCRVSSRLMRRSTNALARSLEGAKAKRWPVAVAWLRRSNRARVWANQFWYWGLRLRGEDDHHARRALELSWDRAQHAVRVQRWRGEP